jgi:hypothetical protein
MSRLLSFQLRMEKQSGGAANLRLRTKSGLAAASLAPEVPAGSIQSAFAVFAAIDKVPAPGPAVVVSEREFLFSLPPSIAGSPWRVALILNLIDNAVFSSETPGESSLIETVTVESDALAGLEFGVLQADLETRKEEARQEITSLLPPNFTADVDLGREWPADGSSWFFDIRMQTERAIDQASACRDMLLRVDDMIAWTAFETEKSPAEYLESGLVPYPCEVAVSGSTASYSAEMPPVGTGLPLVLMRDILENHYAAKVKSWTLLVSQGW